MDSVNLTHRQENRSLTQEKTYFVDSGDNSDQEIPRLQEAEQPEHTVLEIEEQSGRDIKTHPIMNFERFIVNTS